MLRKSYSFKWNEARLSGIKFLDAKGTASFIGVAESPLGSLLHTELTYETPIKAVSAIRLVLEAIEAFDEPLTDPLSEDPT